MNVRRRVDLTEWASPIEEQWQLGSCTGQAIVGAYELLVKKYYPEKFVDLSRLFVYYNARELEGFVKEDVGAYIRSGIKAVSKYGICSEHLWPYNIEKFAVRPPQSAYADASTRVINGYYKIYNLNSLINTLALDHPAVIGIQLYGGFTEVDKSDPILKMPKPNEEPTGGHAVCIVGYDLDQKQFLCRNSFGIDWGDQGYCWIPFEYADKNFSDMWAFNIQVK